MCSTDRLTTAIATLAVSLLLGACEGGRETASLNVAGRAAAEAWQQPAPRVSCGPDDAQESGIQGRVTKEDRESGRSQESYNCNLERYGQFQGEGASWQFAWFDHCGYYGTANNPEQENLGTVVIDARDPVNPRAATYLTEPAMLDPWESLKVNEGRRLLAGVEMNGPGFDIYDIGIDCAQPLSLASVDFPDVQGHAGNFSADGLTYWGASVSESNVIYPIDVRDPTNPQLLAADLFPFNTHDLSTNLDGNRLYLARIGNMEGFSESFAGPNGLAIFDVSDIQNREPDPQIKMVGNNYWVDGSVAQMTQPIRINGKPYLLITDEQGSGGADSYPRACEEHLPPYAFGRILDISDETRPTLVSKLMLETHDPRNCDRTSGDEEAFAFNFIYDVHYCTVDDVRNAEVVACSFFNSGFRVFDIRDPFRPKEIAYYVPPAQTGRGDSLPGSQHPRRVGDSGITAAWASAHIRLVEERGELWSTSQDNGFQILRFTNGVWPFPDSD